MLSAYSIGNECNGIWFVNMLENRSVLSNKLKIPSVPFKSSFKYEFADFKVARMVKNCQIPINKNYSLKGKSIIYFVQNKELKENINYLYTLFKISSKDLDEKNVPLEKKSFIYILLTVFIPLILLAIIRVLPHILF